MTWSIASPPELDAGALEDLRLQVREAGTGFDDELTRNLNASVVYLQGNKNRQLLNATVVYTRERFPHSHHHGHHHHHGHSSGRFYLPPSPLVSVTSVQYVDGDGATQTWLNSLYDVVINTEPGYLEPVHGETYPQNSRDVTVTYVSGYGTTWGTVDEMVRQVVLMRAETFYRGTDWQGLLEQLTENVSVGDEFFAYP